jgi:pyruvate dehydrogenase E1 component alpha subunit/2-oxoisovalerate dehydrogenase E1 component alpha subunit
MCRSRALDVALVALQRQGRIGFHTAAIGQEAVSIGAAFCLEPSDWVFPARREGAILLARGFPLSSYLAQWFGSAADRVKGRQIPSHPSDRGKNFVSTSASVGSQLPHAVGAAWAARKSGARSVAAAFTGEGGTSTGDFHAAMNFAAVFRAPCIIVCQNNRWALSTPSSRQTASSTYAVKAKAYGMPSARVDGNDVLAVYRAIADARVRAVAGAGPTFIECVTERHGADAVPSEPGDALHDESPETWAGTDPILRFRRHLAYLQVLDAASDEAMRAELEQNIAAEIALAEARPKPALSTMFEDVYGEQPWHLVEQARHAGGD